MRLKYVGDGAFLPGVPKRDLRPEEVEAWGPEGVAFLVRSGLYERVEEQGNEGAEEQGNGEAGEHEAKGGRRKR